MVNARSGRSGGSSTTTFKFENGGFETFNKGVERGFGRHGVYLMVYWVILVLYGGGCMEEVEREWGWGYYCELVVVFFACRCCANWSLDIDGHTAAYFFQYIVL